MRVSEALPNLPAGSEGGYYVEVPFLAPRHGSGSGERRGANAKWN